MLRSFAILALSWFSILACGCGSGKKAPVLVDVSGKVTLDKKPLAEGNIMFVTPGEPGDNIEIKNGVYSGKAKVGDKRRVEIYAFKEGPMEKDPMSGEMVKTQVSTIPSIFNTESNLTATIKEGGDNKFDFDLSSK